MKKLLFLVVVFALLGVVANPALAKKPVKDTCTTIQSGELIGSDGLTINTGYDSWGYNYQARLFNGGYCDAYRDAAWCQEWKDVNLAMKWNDAWLSNKDCDDDGSLDRHLGYPTYIGSGAWLTNHQSGEYTTEWSILGDWVLDFTYNGRHYVHDMSITDDSFIGEGSAQFSSQEWTVSGYLTDNNVDMTIKYNGSSYEVYVLGIIDNDGTMEGTWSTNTNQNGTWVSTSGAATREDCDWNYFVKIVAAPADAYAENGFWYSADGKEIGPVIWGAFAIIQQVENDSCAGLKGLQYKSPVRAGLGNW